MDAAPKPTVREHDDALKQRVLEVVHRIISDQTGFDGHIEAETDFAAFASLCDFDATDIEFLHSRIQRYFMVWLPKTEWNQLFGVCNAGMHEASSVSNRLTFGNIAEFIVPHVRNIAIRPVSILGKPCKPAGAFREIESALQDMHSERVQPSASISQVLRKDELRRIWGRLTWLSENRLPPLRTTRFGEDGDKLLLWGFALAIFVLFFVSFVAAIEIWDYFDNAEAKLPVWAFCVIAAFLLILIAAGREMHFLKPPRNVTTFADLARGMTDEPHKKPEA